MPAFILLALFVLLILLAVVWGIVALATSCLRTGPRPILCRTAVLAMARFAAFYTYLVVLLLYAHFDTRDFFSPSAESPIRRVATSALEGVS